MGLRNDLPAALAPEGELSEAWASEVSRRLQEVRDGSAELVSLDEVKRRMQERRAARRPPAR